MTNTPDLASLLKWKEYGDGNIEASVTVSNTVITYQVHRYGYNYAACVFTGGKKPDYYIGFTKTKQDAFDICEDDFSNRFAEIPPCEVKP